MLKLTRTSERDIVDALRKGKSEKVTGRLELHISGNKIKSSSFKPASTPVYISEDSFVKLS